MRQAGGQSGQALGRKEGRRASGVHTLGAKKNPVGLNLRGGVIGFGLLSVPGKGANDQKEGEKQTQGKIP